MSIGQAVLEILQFVSFSRWPLSSILDFQIFKLLLAHQVWRANIYRHTKFRQNPSNGCGDIAFNFVWNGGSLPSWIFLDVILWTVFSVRRANMHQHSKVRRNRSNCCWDRSNLSFFLRWWLCAIFDLCGKFWDDSQIVLGGLYHYAKFGWNRFNHFDNKKVLIFCIFDLKMAILALKVKVGENLNFLHFYPFRNATTWNWHHTKKTA